VCHAGNVPEKEKDGCVFFDWAGFDEDGNPVWKVGKDENGKIDRGSSERKINSVGQWDLPIQTDYLKW